MINGKVVIPKGKDASGQVTDAHAAGRLKGGATLNLALTSITIQGKQHTIQTYLEGQQPTGKGKRTAGMVGGGAGGGAVIEGIAGGGKGTAVGALAGVAIGTAEAAFTGNRDISLPPESPLSFTLQKPITVQPKQ
jgi:hypothetical protein